MRTSLKIVAGVVVLATLTGGMNSADAMAGAPHHVKRCAYDGYGSISKMQVPRGTACGTAYKVVDKWMQRSGIEDVAVRIGRDGVLWRCYGSRAYGRLNPWYINCTSSQGRWINRYGGYMSYRMTWFEYRS